jgi:hypothetical protein
MKYSSNGFVNTLLFLAGLICSVNAFSQGGASQDWASKASPFGLGGDNAT